MAKVSSKRGAYQEIRIYRGHQMISQARLAEALGVTQAYISQLERGHRRVSRKLAAKLASLPELNQLPATVFPEDLARLEGLDLDHASDLATLGYPGFRDATPGAPKNPAAVIVSILARKHVAPAVMAAIPWVLLRFPEINIDWLVAQARLNNLQNRLGFLTDLALQLGAAPQLEKLRDDLEDSRLAKEDTLARDLSAAERQFFDEHRSDAARHWNLLTGLTKDTLPYLRG